MEPTVGSHLAAREKAGSAISQREMEKRARVRLRLAEKEWACGLGLVARPHGREWAMGIG